MVGVNFVEVFSDLCDGIRNISHVMAPELEERVINDNVEATISRRGS